MDLAVKMQSFEDISPKLVSKARNPGDYVFLTPRSAKSLDSESIPAIIVRRNLMGGLLTEVTTSRVTFGTCFSPGFSVL